MQETLLLHELHSETFDSTVMHKIAYIERSVCIGLMQRVKFCLNGLCSTRHLAPLRAIQQQLYILSDNNIVWKQHKLQCFAYQWALHEMD